MILGAFLCAVIAYSQPQLTKDNIDEVLSAMTLEEKATLLVGSGWGSMVGGLTNSDEVLVSGAAGTTRAIQRLGITSAVLADGPAGLRINPARPGTNETYYCTGFPTGTALSSTWNTPLVEELTTAMGNEVKEYGVDALLAPGINLQRNPLCGRDFEYYSEDPLLTGEMAAAFIRGIQSNGVGVSAKHFAANNQETNRMLNDVEVNPRALREMYLKGFEIAVKEASPWTVMSSYNKINGVFTQQSRDLLKTILRDEWGFNGIVMTDWSGPRNTAAQIGAMNDLLEPGLDKFVDEIVKAVNDGTLSEESVNDCARNMLGFIVKTPRFNGYNYSEKPDLKAHAELTRKAAAEGMVLLENRTALPMKDVKKVALYGVGSYEFIAGGTGSGNVNKQYVRNIADGLTINGYEVDKDISDWYERYIPYSKTTARNIASKGNSTVLLGEEVTPELDIPRSFIDSRVDSTDIAVLTISRNAGEASDRRTVEGDFFLSGQERRMLQDICDAYHHARKKVVVVLNIGGVIETDSWKKIPDAVLLAWTPGQEGGYTVADVLSGSSYPSGRLPMTFPVSYFDVPSSFNFPFDYSGENSFNPFVPSEEEDNELAMLFGKGKKKEKNIDFTRYEEGIWIGYRYFRTAGVKVSYPFGFGLTYTTFNYSNPRVKVSKDGTVTASVVVTNVGDAVGKEVVQIYVTAPDGGLVKPEFELRAFAKTGELEPGASETLTMAIDPYTLASFNESSSSWETCAGEYVVNFGASSEDIRAKAAFKLSKAQNWPVHAVLLPKTAIEEINVK